MSDPTAEWPPLPSARLSDDVFYRHMAAAYSHRLRTTAEALRGLRSNTCCEDMHHAANQRHGDANPCPVEAEYDAILARLEQEGLA